MAHGKYEESLVSRLLEAGEQSAEEKTLVKQTAMSLYAGGADTVS
jgi:hypothetical protein